MVNNGSPDRNLYGIPELGVAFAYSLTAQSNRFNRASVLTRNWGNKRLHCRKNTTRASCGERIQAGECVLNSIPVEDNNRNGGQLLDAHCGGSRCFRCHSMVASIVRTLETNLDARQYSCLVGFGLWTFFAGVAAISVLCVAVSESRAASK